MSRRLVCFFYTIYSDLFRFLIYEQISPAYYPFGNRPHGERGRNTTRS